MNLRDLFAPVPDALLGYLPRHRYLLLELRAPEPSLLAEENIVSLMAILEKAESHGRLEELGAALADCATTGRPPVRSRYQRTPRPAACRVVGSRSHRNHR